METLMFGGQGIVYEPGYNVVRKGKELELKIDDLYLCYQRFGHPCTDTWWESIIREITLHRVCSYDEEAYRRTFGVSHFKVLGVSSKPSIRTEFETEGLPVEGEVVNVSSNLRVLGIKIVVPEGIFLPLVVKHQRQIPGNSAEIHDRYSHHLIVVKDPRKGPLGSVLTTVGL